MSFIHKELAEGRWFKLSFFDQMANIGSEVGRTILWRKKGDNKENLRAFYRALELLDLTIQDSKNRDKLRELCRLREVLSDYFMYDNIYQSTDNLWHNYFFPFEYASRIKKVNLSIEDPK